MVSLPDAVEHELERITACVLQGNKSSTAMCLSYCDLNTRERWETLGQRLQAHGKDGVEHITGLDISGNQLGPKTIVYCSENVLRHLSSLVYLDLHDNRIGTDGFQILLSYLRQYNPKLTRLNLNENIVKDIGIQALSMSLSGTRISLTELHLISNFITPQGISYLETYMKSNRDVLRILVLDDNALGDKGCSLLCPALQRYARSLRTLSLGDAQLCNEACKHIARLLGELPMVEKLLLPVNQISGKGLVYLAQGVGKCPSLRTLDLGCNPLGAEGFEYLCNGGLSLFRNIELLDLICTELEDLWAHKLLAFLQASPRSPLCLRELRLEGNRISDRVGVALVDWAKNNETNQSSVQNQEQRWFTIRKSCVSHMGLVYYGLCTLFAGFCLMVGRRCLKIT